MSKDDNNTFEISRRKTLAALGTIGAASAGAGLGTSAWFSDTESFENNIVTAGTMDLIVEYYSWWDQGMAGSGSVSGAADGKAVSAELSDVKPGDNGLIALSPRIETNPAYLWLCGELTANDENGLTEPEALVDDTGGDPGEWQGELAQSIDVTVGYCDIEMGDDDFGPDAVSNEQEIWSGSLADFLMAIQAGVPLDGDAGPDDGGFFEPGDQSCFAGTDDDGVTPSLCLDWEVPTTVGNEIQGDSLEFDLQMYAEQCRHNDGTQNPCACPTTVGDGWAKQQLDFTEGSFSRARYGNDATVSPWELKVGTPGSGNEDLAQKDWTFGQEMDWEYSYDGDTATFTVDGTTVSHAIPEPQGMLAIQTKADEGTVTVTDIELKDGSDEPVALSGETAVEATNDGEGRAIRYLAFGECIDPSAGFTITGKLTLDTQEDYNVESDEGIAMGVVVE